MIAIAAWVNAIVACVIAIAAACMIAIVSACMIANVACVIAVAAACMITIAAACVIALVAACVIAIAYCHTNLSTVVIIKHECKSASSEDTVCRVYDKQGGMLGENSLGELPRNHTQVTNMRCSTDMTPKLCSKIA